MIRETFGTTYIDCSRAIGDNVSTAVWDPYYDDTWDNTAWDFFILINIQNQHSATHIL